MAMRESDVQEIQQEAGKRGWLRSAGHALWTYIAGDPVVDHDDAHGFWATDRAVRGLSDDGPGRRAVRLRRHPLLYGCPAGTSGPRCTGGRAPRPRPATLFRCHTEYPLRRH